MKLQKLSLIFAINFACITFVKAEPRITELMPKINPVTAKVNVPLINGGEQNIPVLPKSITGDKNKPYAGGNLAIIHKGESNKPLPIKKIIIVKKEATENKNNKELVSEITDSLEDKSLEKTNTKTNNPNKRQENKDTKNINETKNSGLKIIENGKIIIENFNANKEIKDGNISYRK